MKYVLIQAAFTVNPSCRGCVFCHENDDFECPTINDGEDLVCNPFGASPDERGIFVEPTPENIAKSVQWRLTR